MTMIELHLGLSMAIGIFIIGRPAANLLHDNVRAPSWSPSDHGHLARLCSLMHLVEITSHLRRRSTCSLAENHTAPGRLWGGLTTLHILVGQLHLVGPFRFVSPLRLISKNTL